VSACLYLLAGFSALALTSCNGGPLDGVFPALTIDDVTVVEGDAGTVDAVFTVSLSEAATLLVESEQLIWTDSQEYCRRRNTPTMNSKNRSLPKDHRFRDTFV
jgi:hypothetical protein